MKMYVSIFFFLFFTYCTVPVDWNSNFASPDSSKNDDYELAKKKPVARASSSQNNILQTMHGKRIIFLNFRCFRSIFFSIARENTTLDWVLGRVSGANISAELFTNRN